jgi:hypothetical protein
MFEDFEAMDFPTLVSVASFSGSPGGYVYVVFWALADGHEVPFYVGQTTRLSGRMWDYCTAQFAACTDFRVGEAILYLREHKGCRIILRYKGSENPTKDERELIRELQVSGPRLLNGLVAYDYRSTEPAAERLFIHRFCDLLLNS